MPGPGGHKASAPKGVSLPSRPDPSESAMSALVGSSKEEPRGTCEVRPLLPLPTCPIPAPHHPHSQSPHAPPAPRQMQPHSHMPLMPLLPLPALLWPYAKTPMSHLKPGELLCCSGPSAPGRLSSLYCTSHLQGLVGAAVRVRSQRGQGKGGSEQVMNHRGVAARSSLCPQCSSPHSLMQHHGCPASIW